MATAHSRQKLTVLLDKAGLVTFGEHLRGEGREPLARTATGRVYARLIDRDLEALTRPAAPAAPAPANPLTVALHAHTEDGRAIWYGLSSLALSAALPVAVREAAARVVAEFDGRAPSARHLPAERVVQATLLRARLAERRADLDVLPPAPGGERWGAWLDRWCAAGVALGGELVGAAVAREQGAPEAPPGPTVANVVNHLNGLLLRARRALRDEVDADPTLPRTLEAEVFGLYDSLVQARRRRVEQAASREAAAAEPPAVA
jgi:hypothetical protein